MSHLGSITAVGEAYDGPKCLADFVDAPATIDELEQQMRAALGFDPIYLMTPQIVGFSHKRGVAPSLYQDLGPICLRYVGVREPAERSVIPVAHIPRALGKICTMKSGFILFRHASRRSRAETVADESSLLGVGIGIPVELSRVPFEPPELGTPSLSIVR